ncbi:protein of unknown function [Bradyrhizobium sp. ORS 285]|nr:hypothetical protein BRAO285_850056 [Bradyrhizobium sp. ORS 285]SMX61521.1 protein of unknown function [Bradyrhizobium sp. ORS 285]
MMYNSSMAAADKKAKTSTPEEAVIVAPTQLYSFPGHSIAFEASSREEAEAMLAAHLQGDNPTT